MQERQVLGRGCLSEDVSVPTKYLVERTKLARYRFHVQPSDAEPSVDQSSRGSPRCIAFSQRTAECE